MFADTLRKVTPAQWGKSEAQAGNIVMITFWSQFSVYAFNTILILFLTRPLLRHGLGYSEAQAYAFVGVSQATGYLMPMLGGYMADSVVGIRRSILLGSVMLAMAYLLVLLSGYTLQGYGDKLFIAAYALIPVTNSLLMGTASSMVSRIYTDNASKAKSAMTFYYMAINVGSLLATILSPRLMESAYGPLSVMAIAFAGKSIAALNFAWRYPIYDTVIWGEDTKVFRWQGILKLAAYVVSIYAFTLFAYFHVQVASLIISAACAGGILVFIYRTLLLQGESRSKQLLAVLLILEAVVFFVIYNQMSSTLVLFAAKNTNLNLFGLHVSPAHYQMLNPVLIILLGMQLPKWYQRYPGFSIPYQFAAGALLSGLALVLLAWLCAFADHGIINGNWLALVYIMISLAELWVSAIGLSMIGLYCDRSTVAFAMGIWYLACSMAHAISGNVARWVAIPAEIHDPALSLPIYEQYFTKMGLIGCITGVGMFWLARRILKRFDNKGMVLQ